MSGVGGSGSGTDVTRPGFVRLRARFARGIVKHARRIGSRTAPRLRCRRTGAACRCMVATSSRRERQRARRGRRMRPGRQRVGRGPGARRPHRRDRRQAQGSIQAPAPVVRRQDHRRFRIRPRHPARSADRPGRGARGGDQRRQLQHHGGPRRARDVRDRAGRRPYLRPPPRPRSTSGSASPPSRPSRGPPTRCCGGCYPAITRRAGPTRPARSRSSSATFRPRGPAARWASSRSPAARKLVSVTRLGTARVFDSDLVGQEGDILHLVVATGSLGELQERLDGSDTEGSTDARRDRGRRQRRLVHREGARRERPRRPAAREGPRSRGPPRGGTRHRAARRRCVRGQLVARREGRHAAMSSSPRPATTRTTSSSRCCRSRSSRCRASLRG